MLTNPYYLLEVASAHGGKISYLNQIFEEFKNFRNVGIKFQPFKYDLLAAEDYKGYSTYQKLYFTETEWASIIKEAHDTKDVWLDLFDEYSLKILVENSNKIKGFKIQASVLGNFSLFSSLGKVDLSNKYCILNVSGYEESEVEKVVRSVEYSIKSQIIIQAGFQSHPTEFLDSGLSKMAILKKQFPEYLLSFTDHLQDTSNDVLLLPFVAQIIGASIIEKHIKCEFLPTEYDYYSSIIHSQFDKLLDLTNRYSSLLNAPFINEKERQYLNSSRLVPILKTNKNAGQILSKDDFDYKRTCKTGINSFLIFNRIAERNVLATSLPNGSTIQSENLKRAVIGAVIVCRMKSKRLPKKALAKIGNLTSVELCIKNTLQFQNIDHVILATSTHPDDSVLKDFTYSDSVKFFKGSEDDVIERFTTLANQHALDIIVRVTGDSPFRSDEVFQILLASHFDRGADYTAAGNAALGTNIEIINVEALKRVHALFKGAPYSEYMSYYFKNNPKLFRLNIVSLPPEYSNSYRLTLDYSEDLELFREIEKHFNYSVRPFNALELYSFLKNNPTIADINKDCEVAYSADSDLIKTIIEETTYKGY